MPPCPRCGKEAIEKENKYRCWDCGITFDYGEGSLNFAMASETGEMPELPHFKEAYQWKFGKNS